MYYVDNIGYETGLWFYCRGNREDDTPRDIRGIKYQLCIICNNDWVNQLSPIDGD